MLYLITDLEVRYMEDTMFLGGKKNWFMGTY